MLRLHYTLGWFIEEGHCPLDFVAWHEWGRGWLSFCLVVVCWRNTKSAGSRRGGSPFPEGTEKERPASYETNILGAVAMRDRHTMKFRKKEGRIRAGKVRASWRV